MRRADGMVLRFAHCASRTIVLLIAALTCAVLPLTQAAPRPNVVLILADDLGAECLGCYGSTSYKTPHLDELARTGMRFEHCYATPLCSPSRVQLMTGQYGFRTGWTNLIGSGTPKFFDTRTRTIGHMMQAAGYATALAGKWQLADFRDHPDNVKQSGFDEYSCWAWVFNGRKTSRYWDPFIWQNGRRRDDVIGKYGEDVFCDFLIDFITRHGSQPFFVYYPMALVHAPFEPTPDSPNQTERTKASPKNFPDMIAYMDKIVGRLIAALDNLGLRENTLILFTGDNGTTHGIRSKVGDAVVVGGKGTVTHIGTHVPLIANWKGTIPPGRVSADLIDFSDFVPTIAELTGASLPKSVILDGHSFAPQLLGKPSQPRQWVFVQLGQRRFVRDARWLLHDDGRLYDITEDPGEKRDLSTADSIETASAAKRLQAVLDQLRSSRGIETRR